MDWNGLHSLAKKNCVLAYLIFWTHSPPEGRRAHRPQVGIGAGVEGVLELLGVHLAVLVQNVGIHAGDHVDLGVARVALGGLQVAVVESLAGRAAMPSTMARTRAAAWVVSSIFRKMVCRPWHE